MMNLVKLALRRPYTMAIAAMLIILMDILSVTRMIVDIFPTIDIPVVFVAWSYNGLSAEDMERRVVLVSERAYSTTVNGIDHIESLSIPGQGILKIYFQQGADIGTAIAQISAQSNAVLRIAPPGMQPPNIIQFNASNVPVVQVTDLPVGIREGIPVMLGDVATVRDSFAQQTNVVRINGQRASFVPILKNSTASTITVVDAVKNMLPDIQATAPDGIELNMD